MDSNDIGKFLEFSLVQWFSDRKTLKLFVALVILTMIILVTSNMLMGQMYSDIDPQALEGGEAQAALQLVVSLVGVVVVLAFVGFISEFVKLAIVYLTNIRALEMKKYRPIKLTLAKYVMLLVLGLVEIIVAVLSLFNPKMLWVLAGAIVLVVAGLAASAAIPVLGGLLFMLGVLAAIAYMFVVIYNMLRLSVSSIAFVEKEMGIMEALKLSWKKTEGNVWMLLLAFVVLGIVIIVITYLASIPMSAYSVAYMFSFGLMAAEMGGSTSGLAAMQAISGMFFDPIYNCLGIIVAAVGAWGTIASSYFLVAIYENLAGKAKRPAKKAGKAKKKRK